MEKLNNIKQKKSLNKPYNSPNLKVEKDNNEKICYIYERNPDTGEIFRRKKGDYTTRECINPAINSVPRI